VLHTRDFGCWQAAVARILGQHRSELLSASNQFQAHFRVGRFGSYSVLHLQGRGRLRLNREQREHSVLWLLLRGITAERINGQSWLGEPGTGLLFQPGDAMECETSDTLEGLSILIPAELYRQPSRPVSPLLTAGPLHQRILASARALAVAAALQFAGAEIAADQLTEVLLRLHRLRGLLLDRERDNCSVAELMVASGLIASGVTAADYRRRPAADPQPPPARTPVTNRLIPQPGERTWLGLHLGLGLAWCALLASRAPGGSWPGATGFQVFWLLLAAGWLPSWALAWWQVRHRRLRSLLLSDLLGAGLLTLLACTIYVPLFFFNVAWFPPMALLPRGVLAELLARRLPGTRA
jgi:hypothetical protein